VIQLTVSASPILGLNFAPEFIEPLQNMTFTAGSAFNYTLPEIEDEEGELFSTSVEMGIVARYMTFDDAEGRFVINKGSTFETDVGVYAIKIELVDVNNSTREYEVLVTIESAFVFTGFDYEPTSKRVHSVNAPKAKIEQISKIGLVKISFSKKMKIPTEVQIENLLKPRRLSQEADAPLLVYV
jgi:hypothetical protein